MRDVISSADALPNLQERAHKRTARVGMTRQRMLTYIYPLSCPFTDSPASYKLLNPSELLISTFLAKCPRDLTITSNTSTKKQLKRDRILKGECLKLYELRVRLGGGR